MNEAIEIELPVWKDPQNFVIVEHVRDEAWVNFRCWDDNGTELDTVGCLHFEGVWFLNSERFREQKGYPNIKENLFRSYYLKVPESDLLLRLLSERTNRNPDWQNYDNRNYEHYVVESNDFYYDIIASKVSFAVKTDIESKRCFRLWENV